MTTPKWLNGLRVQIILLMTLALLPLGLVAVYQTNRVEDQAERNARMVLLALTERAAKSEELKLKRASGVARFFASVAQDFIDNPDKCVRELPQFIQRNTGYTFIGILPTTGQVSCSSAEVVVDFSELPDFDAIMRAQEPAIVINRQAPPTNSSAFVIFEPFEIEGDFAGFVTLSIPHKGVLDTQNRLVDRGLAAMLTLDAQGGVLTERSQLGPAVEELPQSSVLQNLETTRSFAFVGKNQRGENRIYTIVPSESSPATVIGVWQIKDGLVNRLGDYIQPAVFPILMWIASMAVAFLSIHTLVLRHIARLRNNMDRFSLNRSIRKDDKQIPMPNELRALTSNFDMLTDAILREEANLEDMVREKNVLIKEVHHRVKNNLQLISSIMNMQIRTAKQEETKSVLSRVQDRVLSLATIHRDLYQSQHGGKVDVRVLATEIIEKSLEVGLPSDADVDLDIEIDLVLLYPDQAVPLSLLVAEGMTNVMKYFGMPSKGQPFIRAVLRQDGKNCTLTLANSIGDAPDVESTGFGAQLINAFAVQLGGKLEINKNEGSYTMRVSFSVEDFEPEMRDF